jgi:hypothetical protein
VEDDGSIPVDAEANWLEHNNFRSGDLGAADGLKSPDLKPTADLCEVECSEGTLWVHVLAGNEGQSDVTAGQDPTIELFAVEDGERRFLASHVLEDGVEAGRYLDSVIFEIEDEDPEDWDSLVVRLSSTALECDPDNNDIEIDGPFCD